MTLTASSITEQAPEYSELPPAYSEASTSLVQPSTPPCVRFATSTRGLSQFLPDDTGDGEDFLRLPPAVGVQPSRGREDTAAHAELPPTYTHFDERPMAFSLCGNIINTIGADRREKPRYQLKQQLSKSGRLWRLQIRRLLPSESRRLSMQSPGSLAFDADTMLYDAENVAALYALRNRMEVQIRGRKAGTYPGHIEVCNAGRDGFDFKRCTRPPAKHWSREENMRKIHKWGWSADMEVERTNLLTSKNTGKGIAEWTHKDELTDVIRVIAAETEGELVLRVDVPDKIRDVLVTCWATKCWVLGRLESWRPPDVKLSKWQTVG